MYVNYDNYCLFFFKQKTAYEMRISDWSSDVCSSDLLDHLANRGVRAHRERLADHPGLESFHLTHFIGLPLPRHAFVDDADAPQLRHRDRQPALGDGIHRRRQDRQVQEIGRESCRERVCPYV